MLIRSIVTTVVLALCSGFAQPAKACPAATQSTAMGVRYEVCVADLRRHRIQLHWRDPTGQPYRSLARMRAAVEADGHRLVYALNGGIFDTDMTPLGLHVENGQELRPLNLGRGGGNFYLQPNGVFFIDDAGRAELVESRRYRKVTAGRSIRVATQSGPYLLRRGRIDGRFKPLSNHRTVRTAIGVRDPRTVVLVRSLDPVTMYHLAALFRDDLGVRDALYLDGSTVDSIGPDLAPDHFFASFVGMLAVVDAPP